MPLSSTPVFPLGANDPCERALEREPVARFLSLIICPQRLQRRRDSRLCFLRDLKEFSGHLRAGRRRASHAQDYCEQEPAERRQLEHAPDKIRPPVKGGVASALTASATQSC